MEERDIVAGTGDYERGTRAFPSQFSDRLLDQPVMRPAALCPTPPDRQRGTVEAACFDFSLGQLHEQRSDPMRQPAHHQPPAQPSPTPSLPLNVA